MLRGGPVICSWGHVSTIFVFTPADLTCTAVLVQIGSKLSGPTICWGTTPLHSLLFLFLSFLHSREPTHPYRPHFQTHKHTNTRQTCRPQGFYHTFALAQRVFGVQMLSVSVHFKIFLFSMGGRVAFFLAYKYQHHHTHFFAGRRRKMKASGGGTPLTCHFCRKNAFPTACCADRPEKYSVHISKSLFSTR